VLLFVGSLDLLCLEQCFKTRKVADAELVNMSLNGFLTSWEPFVKAICAREDLPNFERQWDDCIQEETQMESKASKKVGDENLALFGQPNKGRAKGPSKGKAKSEESTPQEGNELSKIKYFVCHKMAIMYHSV
jgi:hypothetical protein